MSKGAAAHLLCAANDRKSAADSLCPPSAPQRQKTLENYNEVILVFHQSKQDFLCSVCVCVSLCERESGRERKRSREKERAGDTSPEEVYDRQHHKAAEKAVSSHFLPDVT